jgi:3-phenylpropionate/trans-cinnamate dioxygenase ferredoxin subunit
MPESIKVGNASEFAPGMMKEVWAGQIPILIARIGDAYYATQGRCPHMGGILAKGKLDGSVVTCPRHGSQFVLTDGKVVRWMKGKGFMAAIGKILKHPRPLKTYPVSVENDNIFVKLG